MNIEQKTNDSPISIIAALLFVASAVQRLSFFRTGFSMITLVELAAFVLFAVLLFMKRRDKLLLIPVALLSIMDLYAAMTIRAGLLILSNVVSLLASLSMLAIVAAVATDYLPQYREKAKQLWFLPGILFILILFINIFSRLFFRISANMLSLVLQGAGYFLAAMWIARSAGYSTQQASGTRTVAAAQNGDGYCDMLKCILLLLFTFGIYYYIWIYRTTAYLNRVEGEEPRVPVNKLLLCMFVPFYSIYWMYQSAQRLDKLANSKGIKSDLSVICLVLAFFVGIIPPMLMQDKINTIAGIENGTVTVEPQTATAASATTANTANTATAPNVTLGVAEELKKYKELLDSGVLTQEEFDKMKKQLLGL